MAKKKVIIEEKKLLKIELGCGQLRNRELQAEGYIGLDISSDVGAEIVHDLTKYPWPIEDNSVDSYYACHLFEHIPAKDRPKFMDEVWRTLVEGGRIRLITPGHKCDRAWQDFTHEWPPIVPSSYNYFVREYRQVNGLTHWLYDMKCNFDVMINANISGEWINLRSDEAVQFAAKHYWEVALDYDTTLIARP